MRRNITNLNQSDSCAKDMTTLIGPYAVALRWEKVMTKPNVLDTTF